MIRKFTAGGVSVAHFGDLGHPLSPAQLEALGSCDAVLIPVGGFYTIDAPTAQAVAEGRCERGIVICTTGIGISISANKVKGVRCALCSEPLSAEMTRRHNDANMMAIGAGFTGPFLADRMVEIFLTTEHEGGRHARRVGKIMALEG